MKEANINNTISNLSVEELKLLIEEQNQQILKDVYETLSQQQEINKELNERVNVLEKNSLKLVNVVEKLVAKIEVINQFVGNATKEIEKMIKTTLEKRMDSEEKSEEVE